MAAGSPSIGGLDVLGDDAAQLGNRLQEANDDRLRLRLQIRLAVVSLAIVPEGAGDLLGQPVVQAVDQVAHVVGDVREMQVLPAAVAGIEDLPQVRQDIDDFAVAGQWRMAEVVDRPAFPIGRDDPLRDRRQRIFELEVDCHHRHPLATPLRRTLTSWLRHGLRGMNMIPIPRSS